MKEYRVQVSQNLQKQMKKKIAQVMHGLGHNCKLRLEHHNKKMEG